MTASAVNSPNPNPASRIDASLHYVDGLVGLTHSNQISAIDLERELRNFLGNVLWLICNFFLVGLRGFWRWC